MDILGVASFTAMNLNLAVGMDLEETSVAGRDERLAPILDAPGIGGKLRKQLDVHVTTTFHDFDQGSDARPHVPERVDGEVVVMPVEQGREVSGE